CLYGQVRKCEHSPGEWYVGIRVLDGVPNPGDFTCNFINLGGFIWYIDQDNEHGPYTDACDVGIPYDYNATPRINLVGSIGEIDVAVPLLGINVANGHVHGVTYNNIDTFSFNSPIYINGASDDLSGCSVVGDLELQGTDEVLSIH